MLYDRRHFVLLATTALVGVAGGLVLSDTARASAGQNDAAVTIPVFVGQLGDASNVTLGNWGSGTAESSKQSVLTGDSSIKVTTQGYYQGARLDFKNPIDLAPALLNPHTYLRFQFKFLGDNSTSTTTDQRPGSSGGGFEETKQAASPFAHMRFLLIMADGARYELIRPVEIPPSEDPDAYSSLAFPVSAIVKQLPAGKTLSGDGAKIKQMAIFGDRYAQFIVGEINVITDETEITAARLEAPIAFAKQEVVLVASAEGGASTLHYSWDWDADDGVQEDSTGRAGTHTYQPSGKGSKTYKVTLTISDVDGLKKPTVETVDLDVSD